MLRTTHHPTLDRSPTRELNPASRLRTPLCVRHTRGECPCQESNLVFDLRKVVCRPSHARGYSAVRIAAIEASSTAMSYERHPYFTAPVRGDSPRLWHHRKTSDLALRAQKNPVRARADRLRCSVGLSQDFAGTTSHRYFPPTARIAL